MRRSKGATPQQQQIEEASSDELRKQVEALRICVEQLSSRLQSAPQPAGAAPRQLATAGTARAPSRPTAVAATAAAAAPSRAPPSSDGSSSSPAGHDMWSGAFMTARQREAPATCAAALLPVPKAVPTVWRQLSCWTDGNANFVSDGPFLAVAEAQRPDGGIFRVLSSLRNDPFSASIQYRSELCADGGRRLSFLLGGVRRSEVGLLMWRQGGELVELAIPRAHPSPEGAMRAALQHDGGAGNALLLRGALPAAWDDPLVLELLGVPVLYAQRVDGVWLVNYSHPLSTHQAFCSALALQAIDRVAAVCKQQAAAAAAAAAAAHHEAAAAHMHMPPHVWETERATARA